VCCCQTEPSAAAADERSFSPSPFDSIHRASASAVEPPQLKMNVDRGYFRFSAKPLCLFVCVFVCQHNNF